MIFLQTSAKCFLTKIYWIWCCFECGLPEFKGRFIVTLLKSLCCIKRLRLCNIQTIETENDDKKLEDIVVIMWFFQENSPGQWRVSHVKYPSWLAGWAVPDNSDKLPPSHENRIKAIGCWDGYTTRKRALRGQAPGSWNACHYRRPRTDGSRV